MASYSNLSISRHLKQNIDLLENGIDLQLEIYNNSTYDGEDVIQSLFKGSSGFSCSRVIELKAFNKVKLNPIH